MNLRRRACRTLPAILAAAMLCAAAGASAQELHKLLDATGRVTFSDRPDETGALQAAPEAESARVPKRIAGISSPRAAALIDTKEAERRLRQAQSAQSQGREPLPGERAKDGTMSERYVRRQEKLRLVVEKAQRRLQETSQPKLSAR
jgi:hypothetical protein